MYDGTGVLIKHFFDIKPKLWTWIDGSRSWEPLVSYETKGVFNVLLYEYVVNII